MADRAILEQLLLRVELLEAEVSALNAALTVANMRIDAAEAEIASPPSPLPAPSAPPLSEDEPIGGAGANVSPSPFRRLPPIAVVLPTESENNAELCRRRAAVEAAEPSAQAPDNDDSYLPYRYQRRRRANTPPAFRPRRKLVFNNIIGCLGLYISVRLACYCFYAYLMPTLFLPFFICGPI